MSSSSGIIVLGGGDAASGVNNIGGGKDGLGGTEGPLNGHINVGWLHQTPNEVGAATARERMDG